jgi:hypothetical protein
LAFFSHSTLVRSLIISPLTDCAHTLLLFVSATAAAPPIRSIPRLQRRRISHLHATPGIESSFRRVSPDTNLTSHTTSHTTNLPSRLKHFHSRRHTWKAVWLTRPANPFDHILWLPSLQLDWYTLREQLGILLIRESLNWTYHYNLRSLLTEHPIDRHPSASAYETDTPWSIDKRTVT